MASKEYQKLKEKIKNKKGIQWFCGKHWKTWQAYNNRKSKRNLYYARSKNGIWNWKYIYTKRSIGILNEWWYKRNKRTDGDNIGCWECRILLREYGNGNRRNTNENGKLIYETDLNRRWCWNLPLNRFSNTN